MLSSFLRFLLMCSFIVAASAYSETALPLPTRDEAAAWLSLQLGTNYQSNDLEQLTSVTLGNKCVQDEDLRYLVHLENLEDLAIYNDTCGDQAITGEGFHYLSRHVNLKKLDLDYNRIDARHLVQLSRLPNLWHLKIQGNRLSGQDLSGLGSFPALFEVVLNDNGFSDETVTPALKVLAGIRTLEIVHLGDNSFSVGNLRHLSGSSIRDIHVSPGLFPPKSHQVRLDALGVTQLAELKGIRVLNLGGLAVDDQILPTLFGIDAESLVFPRRLTIDEEVIYVSVNPLAIFRVQGSSLEALRQRPELKGVLSDAFAKHGRCGFSVSVGLPETQSLMSLLNELCLEHPLSLAFGRGVILRNQDLRTFLIEQPKLVKLQLHYSIQRLVPDFIDTFRLARPEVEIEIVE